MDILNIEIDLGIDLLKKRRNWEEIFHNPNPVILDIGCGKGHFLVEMAKKHPEKNFLGIEIYKKGLRNTKRKIQRMGLINVRLIPHEAKFVLENFFHPNEIREVYINHPDPWPKRRHHKRRLINPFFINMLHAFLEERGKIHLATDFEGYAPVILKSFEGHSGFINILNNKDGYVTRLDDRIPSLFEAKYLEEGRTIYYFIFEKKKND